MEDLVNLKKTAIIFDLDGTLVDSKNQIGTALNQARRGFNFSELSTQRIDELIGLPIDYFLDDLQINNNETNKIIVEFRTILQSLINEGNQLFPGVFEFVSRHRNQGHRIGIATSKPTFLAESVIANSRLVGLIDVIQGTEGFPAKPDPSSILKTMKRLNTDRAIMIGDRVEDIKAANAAGIASVGIAQSFHETSTLVEAGARVAVNSFLELSNSKELFELLID